MVNSTTKTVCFLRFNYGWFEIRALITSTDSDLYVLDGGSGAC